MLRFYVILTINRTLLVGIMYFNILYEGAIKEMIGNVILPDTKKEEWGAIRQSILKRILETFGESPIGLEPMKNKYEEVERYNKYGLEHIRIRYNVIEDEWNEAICVLPEKLKEKGSATAVITIHGTNGTYGKYGSTDLENHPARAYAIDLAKKGFIAISPDQFGYGSTIETVKPEELYDLFYKKYPDWSLTSRRVLAHMRALDVLEQMEFVKKDGFGAIGNSLGGSSVLFLAAMDKRVKATVASTGNGPRISNVYRLLNGSRINYPALAAKVERDGKIPWDNHEIIALCAPRALLCIEPFNDPYNPYVETSMECVLKAAEVYKMLEQPEKISFYMHGDGHDTIYEVRELAYNWLARFLLKK